MPGRRQLQTFAALGMALSPVILPAHMQPTLIGRRAAQEIVERVDQHVREQALRSTQAHQANV
jgi:hypothetical protein